MNYVLLWLLALVGGLLGGFIWSGSQTLLARYFHRRREQQFLRYARILLPEAQTIEVISVSLSDKQAMENIERKLRNASRNL